MQKASFASRAVGLIVELIVSFLPVCCIVGFFVYFYINNIMENPRDGVSMVYALVTVIAIAIPGSILAFASSIEYVIIVLIIIVSNTIIFTLVQLIHHNNSSLGHMAMRTQVKLNYQQSKKIFFLNLLYRNLLKFGFLYLFPFLLLPIFTKEKLPLHDVLSGTRVVKLSDT